MTEASGSEMKAFRHFIETAPALSVTNRFGFLPWIASDFTAQCWCCQR